MQRKSSRPRSISIVQQQERKEDRLEDGEKIQFGFALSVAKKSTNFSSGGKGKGGGICRQLLGRFFSLRHTFCADIYDLDQF
jgi:hypothetical protein